MLFAAFTFFALVVSSAGYLTTALLFRAQPRHFIEILGVSVLSGIGSLGFVLFWLSLVGVTPGLHLMTLILIVCATAVLWLRQKRRTPAILAAARQPFQWRSAFLLIPLAAIGFCIIAMVVSALSYPLYEWDAFSIWFLKAKILLHEPLMPQPAYFHEPGMSYSHRDYPLLQPMFVSGFWGVLGHPEDRWGKLALVLPFVGMVLLFFAEVRRRLSLIVAGWMTAIFLCAPALPFWTPSGDADVMLAAFYLAHLIYLIRWLEARGSRDLAAAGFFASCMWFTKHEGTALSIVSAVLILVLVPIKERTFRRVLLVYPAMLIGILLPWLIWSWNLPASNERYAPRLSPSVLAGNLASIGPGLRLIGAELLKWQSWGLLVPLLLLVTLLTARRFRQLAVLGLWLLTIAHLAIYLLAWVVAEPVMKQMMPAVMGRLILHVTPAIALLIALHWPEGTENSKRSVNELGPQVTSSNDQSITQAPTAR